MRTLLMAVASALALGLEAVSAEAIAVGDLVLNVTLLDEVEFKYRITLENPSEATWLGVALSTSNNMLGAYTLCGYLPEGGDAMENVVREGILVSKNSVVGDTSLPIADNIQDSQGPTSLEDWSFELGQSSSMLSFTATSIAGWEFTSFFRYILIASGREARLGYHPYAAAIETSLIDAFATLPFTATADPTRTPTHAPIEHDPDGTYLTRSPTPSPEEPNVDEFGTLPPTSSPVEASNVTTAAPTRSPEVEIIDVFETLPPTSSPVEQSGPQNETSGEVDTMPPTTSPTPIPPTSSPQIPTARPTFSPEEFEEYETREPQPSISPTRSPTSSPSGSPTVSPTVVGADKALEPNTTSPDDFAFGVRASVSRGVLLVSGVVTYWGLARC